MSAGWNKFAAGHSLLDGNVLVFHLVEPYIFKVYIVRENDLKREDETIARLNLEVHTEQTNTVKVGLLEFLNGIGNGVETYAEKFEAEFRDMKNLLVARSMKLKKLNVGADPKVCKHESLDCYRKQDYDCCNSLTKPVTLELGGNSPIVVFDDVDIDKAVVQLLTRNMLINRNSFLRAMEAEPLSDEKKNKWRREMDWLLSPTNYMVQLVPAKQCRPDGRTIEIMTQKAREDVHLNLPALQKLDSMLLETLNSMMEMEFSYDEGGSRAEGRSKRWWLPTPQVSVSGLSDGQRKKLLTQAKLVLQIF
ncbi:putative transcription factor B3-Domain family [Helianthus anomalus]